MKLLKSHIYFKVLSKDLNYQFEGEKVYCQLHIIKDLSLSPVALKKLSFKICCKFLTSDQKEADNLQQRITLKLVLKLQNMISMFQRT